ncbi:MAG TPA: hypothetical protein VHA06_01695, partial [Candidatus Angelobacter sp.]|nr:hypothetical protein [Candidatus Angelobacter sp.]
KIMTALLQECSLGKENAYRCAVGEGRLLEGVALNCNIFEPPEKTERLFKLVSTFKNEMAETVNREDNISAVAIERYIKALRQTEDINAVFGRKLAALPPYGGDRTKILISLPDKRTAQEFVSLVASESPAIGMYASAPQHNNRVFLDTAKASREEVCDFFRANKTVLNVLMESQRGIA